MNKEFQGARCRICGEKILTPHEMNCVPIVDPYLSPDGGQIAPIIGAPVHIDCWADHRLWQEVARCAMVDARETFSSGVTLFDKEYVGAWTKTPSGSPSGVGAIFLARSAYIYSNLFGLDVKGGLIAGDAEDISKMVRFLRLVRSSGSIAIAGSSMPEVSVQPASGGRSAIVGFNSPDRLAINLYLDDVRLLPGE